MKKIIIIVGSLLAILICVGLFFYNRDSVSPNVNISTKTPMPSTQSEEKLKFTGFALTTYKDSQNKKPIDLLPNVELKSEVYNPLTSQVPGIPFSVEFNQKDGNVMNTYNINIEATDGELLNWDPETSAITSKGNTTSCKPGDILYWSPIVQGESLVKNANIVIVSQKDGKQVGKQSMHVEMKDGFFYVTLGDLEL